MPRECPQASSPVVAQLSVATIHQNGSIAPALQSIETCASTPEIVKGLALHVSESLVPHDSVAGVLICKRWHVKSVQEFSYGPIVWAPNLDQIHTKEIPYAKYAHQKQTPPELKGPISRDRRKTLANQVYKRVLRTTCRLIPYPF